MTTTALFDRREIYTRFCFNLNLSTSSSPTWSSCTDLWKLDREPQLGEPWLLHTTGTILVRRLLALAHLFPTVLGEFVVRQRLHAAPQLAVVFADFGRLKGQVETNVARLGDEDVDVCARRPLWRRDVQGQGEYGGGEQRACVCRRQRVREEGM